MKKLSGVMEIFYTMIVVVVIQQYTFVKIHHFKMGEFYCTVWYLHSAVFSAGSSKDNANINSVSGIIVFLGFVHVKPGIFTDTVFL